MTRPGWIHRRLVQLAMLTSGSALLVASSSLMAWDYFTFRDSMRQDLGSLAGIVAEGARAALLLSDPGAAGYVLEPLAARPDILYASILETGGAELDARGSRERGAVEMTADGSELGPTRLLVKRGVFMDGERLGSVVLEASLEPAHERQLRFAMTLIGSMTIALLASLALAGRLQRPIVRPIAALIERSRAIARHDYVAQEELRAPGELGLLSDAFDEMVAQIHQREQALERHQQVLERAVEERTAALREARDRAEQANRAKSQFLANITHEIRTPINGIVGMIELALDGAMSDEQREQLQVSLQSSDLLLALIDDVLDFSKIEARRLDLHHREFSLRETIGRALRPLALQAAEKGLELSYRVAPGIPEHLVGDPARLTQVLVNLVGNAVKFTQTGSISLKVALEPGAPGSDQLLLRFDVRDTGVGIAGENQDRVFDSFTQVDGSPTRHLGGTGLGLAISRQLVELMGGRIWVESAPGSGSVFRFTVSFERGASEEEPASLHGMRALVIEGDAFARETARDVLFKGGAQVSATSDPGTATRHVRAEKLELIVADLRLVEADAELLAACIAARHAGVTVVWLVPAGNTQRARPELQGATVICPFPPSALLEAARRSTGRAAAHGPNDDDAPATHACRSLRILLAEDNAVNRLLAVRRLQQWGHSVTTAQDGEPAVEAVRRGRFDLILMDVQMPTLDGLEATAQIRRHEAGSGRHTPIVAMTAHALEGDRDRFLAAGMDDYVAKPVRGQALQAAVERAASEQTGTGAVFVPSAEEERQLLEAVDGDRALLGEIASLYVADAPSRLEELRSAIRAGDEPAARRANHTLTGASGNFAAREVDDSLRRLGRLLRAGSLRDHRSAGRLQTALFAAERHVDRLVELLAHVSTGPCGTEATHG